MDIVDLKKKCKEIEKTSALNYYEALQYFMFERMLARISASKYRENLILKGGFLISSYFGITRRTTRDADISINKIKLSINAIKKVLNEVVSIKLNDNVKFKINSIKRIREKDLYYGFSCEIIGRCNNLRIIFNLDITTGDAITPSILKYPYSSLFSNEKILIYSYTIETILAEKVETVLKRGRYNSRMKDYYDIYIISQSKYNRKVLKDAIKNTFNTRKSGALLDDKDSILKSIDGDMKIKQLWKKYLSKNKYIGDISFDVVIAIIKELTSL